MDFVPKSHYTIQDLVNIVRLLREPGGCPWDREQTHESIRKNLIEETYEVADAIDQKDTDLLCEELGDLLLQILLHTRMEEEAGHFTFDDVCDGICKKLIYRHPHVFDARQDLSSPQVLANWENLKNSEKGRQSAKDRLDSVPNSLPALMRSTKLQKRALDFGFTYKDANGALDDLESEVAELKEAIRLGREIDHEMGDVLFSAVNVSRELHADAEEVLSQSANRFADRVKRVEELAQRDGLDPTQLSEEQLDAYWREAKAQE
ncbi:nucleoside triphosphate pyrophosphohydrolase [Ruminococcaceae bacterium OttesenSCG-928-I18]|nr:nucleoside triphosphate pyrophosphohydrolase [Ruminococcaceae bacterium OttesenSCG-928-I18]